MSNNAEVLFPDPQKICIIQPLNAGIIQSMKSRFRKRKVENVLTQIQETEIADVYKIDLKKTLKQMSEIWANLDEFTI